MPLESPDGPGRYPTMTVRMPSELLEQLDDLADEQDKSRSEIVREAVRERLAKAKADESETSAADVPNDAELAGAYRRLLDMARQPWDGSGLRVRKEAAENELYTQETPKDAVMSDLIKPLKRRGFVDIDPAMETVWVVVRPRGGSS